MRKGILLVTLLLTLSTSYAQITLNQSDVGPIGSVFYMGVDSDFPPGATVGPAGANQTWNFAGLNVNDYDTIVFLDPANTPYGADFPSSNLCIQQTSLGDAYAYAVSDPNYLELIGFAADPLGLNQTFIVDQNPALRIANFPFTYQDNYLDTAQIDITVDAAPLNIPLTDSARYKSVEHRTVRSDGWGELLLWSGSYPNTLRVKEITETRDSVWLRTFGFWNLVQDSVYTDSTFTWWDNNQGYYLLEAVFEGPDLDRMTYQDPNPVSISNGIQADVKLYPNPATDRVVVELAQPNFNAIQLLDLQGRILREVSLSGLRNEVDLQGLAPGLYLYRLQSADGEITRAGKLNVTR